MLDGIVTGYEGKFDFPARGGPPDLFYLLASVPRSGSTYLSHVLWATGCLGAPLEYLNFDPAGPYSFASKSPALQRDLWRSVLRRRTSPNGVFGLKAFPVQLEALHQENPALVTGVLEMLLNGGRSPRIVYLSRRDRVAHAVSYARAALSGVWRKEQEGPAPRVDYSEEALREAERLIDGQSSAWEAMFQDLGVQPLRLWHEDVVAEPRRAAARTAEYLGVALSPAAAVQVPVIAKQDQSDAKRWISRYAPGPETRERDA
jgi:LPS sulfotransferase NodH